MRKKMLWICVETAYKDQDLSEEMETVREVFGRILAFVV